MKVLKSLLSVSLVLLFAVVLSKKALAVDLLSAPTLVAPNQKTITAETKPLVVGLTVSGSLVKIYIDGILIGQTEILTDKSNTANFALRSAVTFGRGRHKAYAIAEDRNGKISLASEVSLFNIELPMPAPTMLKPVVNKNTSIRRPFIVGLAKNNSKIKVYIDKKFNGEFSVKNHQSGAANFAYKPFRPLARGNHSVYAVAIDKRGKRSQQSNTVSFSIKGSAAIAQSAKEKGNAAARIEEPKKSVKAGAPVISESSGAVEKKSDSKLGQPDEASRLEKVKNLAAEDSEEKAAASGTGLINEGQLSQSKLKLGLVLFILFLVGVVGWLLWVNRELVKERRAQNKTEDEKNKPDSMGGGPENKLL